MSATARRWWDSAGRRRLRPSLPYRRLVTMDRETQGREMRKLGAAPDYVLGSVLAITDDGIMLVASGTGSQLGRRLRRRQGHPRRRPPEARARPGRGAPPARRVRAAARVRAHAEPRASRDSARQNAHARGGLRGAHQRRPRARAPRLLAPVRGGGPAWIAASGHPPCNVATGASVARVPEPRAGAASRTCSNLPAKARAGRRCAPGRPPRSFLRSRVGDVSAAI